MEEERNLPAVVEESLPERVSPAQNMRELLEATEYMAKAQRQIVSTACKITTPKDWTDQGGNPYLTEAGCMRIASVLPVKTFCITSPKKTWDNSGEFYIYSCEYGAKWTNGLSGEVSAVGTCSSRDPFFAKRGGQLLPVYQVDEPNVIKKCATNGRGNAIRRLLGLQNMTWEELKELGLDRAKTAKVDYTSSKQQDDNPEEAKKYRADIAKMIMEMEGGDITSAQNYLEKITSFTGKDGNQVKGKRETKYLSEKQAQVTYGKVKKDYEDWQKSNGLEGGE